jgi:hypothetical protein
MSRGEKGDAAIHRPSSGMANPSCRGRTFLSLNRNGALNLREAPLFYLINYINIYIKILVYIKSYLNINSNLRSPGNPRKKARDLNLVKASERLPATCGKFDFGINFNDSTEASILDLPRSNDAIVPFDEGRRMASMIPGARFVALEGLNHLILEDESAWPRFLEEIRDFL